ncbi:hypothetical protein ABZU32_29220 [Sphaerisporangium sp. NPDC005288]|uniref:hypothetical protein n=1 Tax=Sphaerisporangium sp. NPDC005288 TaxID=3155114 RepID=UPI0033A7E650
MRAHRRAGLAVSGAVLSIMLSTQVATASTIVYNVEFFSQTCAGGISTSDVRAFRSLLQQDAWEPHHRYAGYPDSVLKYMLQRACTAFDRYQSAERAAAALWG